MNIPYGVKSDTVRRACLFPIASPEFQENPSPAEPSALQAAPLTEPARWHSFAAFFTQSSQVETVLLFGSPLVSNLLPSMVSYPGGHSVWRLSSIRG
jgi:hypothetical protein